MCIPLLLSHTAAHTTTDVHTHSLEEERDKDGNGHIGAEMHIHRCTLLPLFLKHSSFQNFHLTAP